MYILYISGEVVVLYILLILFHNKIITKWDKIMSREKACMKFLLNCEGPYNVSQSWDLSSPNTQNTVYERFFMIK